MLRRDAPHRELMRAVMAPFGGAVPFQGRCVEIVASRTAKHGDRNKASSHHQSERANDQCDRIVFVKDGQEFLPGIQAIATPGHTVGHTIYMITSDGKSLAAIGDLTHHQIILLEKPRIEFAYDTDSKQSANTRVRILDMLASNRIPLIAYHFPWPGLGHVAKSNRLRSDSSRRGS